MYNTILIVMKPFHHWLISS